MKFKREREILVKLSNGRVFIIRTNASIWTIANDYPDYVSIKVQHDPEPKELVKDDD